MPISEMLEYMARLLGIDVPAATAKFVQHFVCCSSSQPAEDFASGFLRTSLQSFKTSFNSKTYSVANAIIRYSWESVANNAGDNRDEVTNAL